MISTNIEVSNLITPFTNAYKLISNEWKHFFEIGVSDYLQSQTEKYYFTYTFLHRGEKVRFWDIYFPIRIKYKKLETNLSNLKDVLDEYKNITIVGTAGSGKSTLIKSIFLDSLKSNFRIPILIELRHFNEYEKSFEEFVMESILTSEIKPSEDTLKRTLKSGKILFLFDGYDELFITKIKEAKKQSGVFREVNKFIDTYSRNNFIITTRPGSGIERLPRFYDFHVCSLEESEVLAFVSRLVEIPERKNRILNSITDTKNHSYKEYLSNPLLLSMYILAFESHPEIPSRKSAFYRNVFDTLYSKHDGITKNSFPRQRISNLDREDFEKILCVFSYITLLKGYYSFTHEKLVDLLKYIKEKLNYKNDIDDLIYDLQTSISILIKDGFEYKFPHRSLQEYFTAQFISKLPTNKKERAYQSIDYSLKSSTTDASFNLWSLCNELDPIPFNKNFVIPHLKRIEASLNKKNNIALFEAFWNNLELEILIDREGVYIVHTPDFNYSILTFSQSFDYQAFYDFFKNTAARTEVQEYVKDLIKELKKHEEEIISLDDKVIDILFKYGFILIIQNCLLKLKNRIVELESDAQTQDFIIDDIISG